MSKEEIQRKIYELNSEEDIKNFVKSRIRELESQSVESTVGQNYTDSFREYISLKTHFKPAERLDDNSECPDLIYDDITPYVELIKAIRKGKWYNELSLFTTIFNVIYEYLPLEDIGFARYMTYLAHKNDRISIKTIADTGCAFCSEKAGMAHNMFKILGMDSEVVSGGREGGMHSYNFVYPNGYGNEPMVLYDPSFFVNFVKGSHKISFGFFKPFKKEDFEVFLSGEPMQLDLSKTEFNYRKLYELEDYTFESISPTYVFGLENAREYKNSKHFK